MNLYDETQEDIYLGILVYDTDQYHIRSLLHKSVCG